MEQSLADGCFTQDRKHFYLEFLEFVRQYPEMKVSLYVPRDDLPLLAKKECSSIVCDLLDLCESGRLTLIGTMPRPHLLEYLRGVGKGQSNPILFQEERVGRYTDSHPGVA